MYAVPTFHTIVNMPTSLGAIGIKYNMSIDPSMTLGEQSIGGGIGGGGSTSSSRARTTTRKRKRRRRRRR